MDPTRRFTADYREEATLKDGSTVHFRLVRPDDKALLADGLARMSVESRFRRFFSHRDRLSASELAYLTELDHERHFALAAGRQDGDREIGLGIARFVMLAEGEAAPAHPGDVAAEAAIAVVDECQGQGLGRMLFERLVLAAAERGVGVFRFDVLAENDQMLALVKSLFPNSTSHVEDGIMTIDCPIPDVLPAEQRHESALYRVLKLAAEGAIRIFRSSRPTGLSPVLKGSGDDLATLIGITDEDGPAP